MQNETGSEVDIMSQKEDIKLYWVSLLIQNKENTKPWLCAMSDGCISLEGAIAIVEKSKQNYRVLSAWIDTFDTNDHKTTVFHECYVNAIGNIERNGNFMFRIGG